MSVLTGLLLYLMSLIEFAIFNRAGVAWFPLTALTAIVIALNSSMRNAVIGALVGGFMLDLHYMFLGPFVLVLLVLTIILSWARHAILIDERYLPRTIVGCGALIALALAQTVVSSATGGASSLWPSGGLLLIAQSIAASCGTLAIVQAAVLNIQRVRKEHAA